jgi:amino acid adenylation domain-containing protein/non-ribosomal peptide synthase protein (TIGR01720 family)
MNELLKKLRKHNINLFLNQDNNIEIVSYKDKIQPNLIQDIKFHKDSLITYLQSKKEQSHSIISIPKTPSGYSLSAAQRRLWILSQSDDISFIYNMPMHTILKGNYDINLFKDAVNSVIDRHEILRTVFKEDSDGELKQFIYDRSELDFSIEYVDFRLYDNIQNKLTHFLEEDLYKPFDLKNGPLVRISFLQTSDDSYVFYYNMHHIISDGWSMNVLANDVLAYYESYQSGIKINLEKLRIQYKDYAAWQLDTIGNAVYESHKKYWLDRFNGDLPLIDLPTSKSRPNVLTYNGLSLHMSISKEVTNEFNTFCKNEGGSLFVGIISVLKILLYKYTAVKDIIIGTPVAGREDAELENQIGFYLNILALRNQIDPKESFTDFYKKVKNSFITAFSSQNYPFDKLVEDLNLTRDISRNPIYDISVTFHNLSSSKENSEKIIDAKIKNLGKVICKNDLEFHFEEIGDYLSFTINYNTDVYESNMIEGFMNHYQQLLVALIADPTEKIKNINYLTLGERSKLLVDFNNTTVEFPKGKTIIDLFEDQSEKTPDNIALVFENTNLTYKELNEKSNQLARCLKLEYAIEKGDMVGVQLNRSEWSIITILGLLKVGAIYIPIDSELPNYRKEYIAGDAQLKLLITESIYVLDLDFYNGNTFAIDVEFNPLDFTTESLELESGENDLAYIIYTSGSTGQPKGVLIENGGVVNTILSQIEIFNINKYKNSLQFASFSFDASISEIFITLLSGGCLFVISEIKRKDIKLLESYILENEIEIATLPPAYLKLIDVESLKGLKVLITAGESPVYDKVVEYLKYGTFYNAYGPTETSICGSIFKIEKGKTLDSSTIPIGSPISNVEIFILDEFNNLQPVGVVGKIYISGKGLARGYLNKSHLTQEKFINSPFNEGVKMYDTGDLGKWLADGNIEYMGRDDQQVKIRGHRIELEEIEQKINSQDSIIQSVVTVREIKGDKFLVAYIVSKSVLNKKNLQVILSKSLPDYMMPSYYVQVDSIPLTTNGKVDTKALPDVQDKDIIQEKYIAPTTDKEQLLVSVWIEVLKRDKIGINDNFYNLGGDSIKSIQVISRLKQQGYTLKVEQMLSTPVIEDLAKLLEFNNITIDQSVVKGEVSLTPIQHYFFNNPNISNKDYYNQSVLLRSKDAIDPKILDQCIAKLVIHHDALRMVYKKENESWKQFNQDVSAIHYKIHYYDLRGEKDEIEALRVLGGQLQSSIDISSGILFHVGHFRLSKGDRLALIIHHLVVDGVSWRILLEDLSLLYEAYQTKSPINLPLKTDSFQYWAFSLNLYTKGEKIKKEKLYWNKLCKQIFPLFPKDIEKKPFALKYDQKQIINLDREITEKLQTNVHGVLHTEINDILLTGLALAIRDVFGLSQSIIKMEGHGREDIIEGVDIGRTVGWFTSVYPFVLNVTEDDNQIESLMHIKEDLRQIPNKGIGYGILKHLADDFEDNLVPEILFNYLGDFGESVGDKEVSIFEYASENIGLESDSQVSQDTLLNISGIIVSGELSMYIEYSSNVYYIETIEKLAFAYQTHLKNLIEELSSIVIDEKITLKNSSEINPFKNDKMSWEIGDEIGLSPNQYRFFQRKRADVILKFIIPFFNENTFEKEFRIFLSKFPSLCLSFKKNEGEIIQRYISSEAVKLNISQIALIKDNIKSFLDSYSKEPFDLFNNEAIRILIMPEIGSKEAYGIISIHHSLLDGYSAVIIQNELIEFFKRSSKNILYPHHFSFINWQKKFLSSKEGFLERKHWIDLLQKQSLFKNEVKGEIELLNFIIQEVSIVGSDFEKLKNKATEFDLPLSAMINGLYCKILKDAKLETKGLYGMMVDSREQFIEGIDIAQVLGVIDNILPLPYLLSENTELSKKFFVDYYSQYLEARMHQQIPYETIREDFRQKTGMDITSNLAGVFNLKVMSHLILEDDIQEVVPYFDKSEDYEGINMTCYLHPNGIKIYLSCLEEIYAAKKEGCSLEKSIKKIIE